MSTVVLSPRLAELEATIRQGLESFLTVGEALTEIRDTQIYRQTHISFRAYCSETFGLSFSRVYQLLNAAETVKKVSTVVETLPDGLTEGAVRETDRLPKKLRAPALQAAIEEAAPETPTTAQVRNSVKRFQPDLKPGAPLRQAVGGRAKHHAPRQEPVGWDGQEEWERKAEPVDEDEEAQDDTCPCCGGSGKVVND